MSLNHHRRAFITKSLLFISGVALVGCDTGTALPENVVNEDFSTNLSSNQSAINITIDSSNISIDSTLITIDEASL